ncbi:MAG: gliding motility-associated ABC transporter substrate-binding protein GldG [Saprospiraceae bacterium]|nr:gliding motility-associated ABC transporter substrate-binding protein GldG [Saprospiraceae bacterium]
MMDWLRKHSWFIILLVGLVIINLLGSYYFGRIDLTEEKRYTLSQATKGLLEEVDGAIFIQILLEGELPADFKRLKQDAIEMLQDFRATNDELTFTVLDPLFGEPDQVADRLEDWSKVGILPTELNIRSQDGQARKRIYPFAIFNYGDRQIAINLLEGNTEGMSPEVAINNSVSLLEYKFANAIAKLMADHKPNIVFSQGQGELTPIQTASLKGNLSAFYNVGNVYLDSIVQIPEDVAALIVAKPTEQFTDKDLFKIDQYVMRGGRVVFLHDPMVVSLDSIGKYGQYVPYNNETNLEDLLFRYGCRVVPNLVLDLESSMIPMSKGRPTQNNQPQLFQWYYHPLASGFGDHPIVKGLDRIDLQFPATVDTVKTKTAISKVPLLTSSAYTRLQYSPVILDFSILSKAPDEAKFNAGPQKLAWLLEGPFTSLFKNRVTTQMQAGLKELGTTFLDEGAPAKIIIVGDGDVARNAINPLNGQVRPLGYNRYVNYTFDNMDFLTNCLEYLLDRKGLIDSRAKNVKLRLLDRPKIQAEKTKWQIINVLVPLFLLIFSGFVFQYLRRRKFGVKL